jgi:uncharacterized membrane protein YidH (DUF202 family)
MKNEEIEKKNGIARMQKDLIERKKEMARIEKEIARREMDTFKKEYTLEKLRTSFERLQLNWIKWDITCIALGFTAYKFYFSRVEQGENLKGYYVTGRELGIFLISLGFLTLLYATIQHKKNVIQLKSQYEGMQKSLSLLLSYIVLGFSFLVFLIVIFRG